MEQTKRGVIGNIAQHPISFSVAFAILFLLNVSFLGAVDALPDPSKIVDAPVATATKTTTSASTAAVSGKAENPIRITIAKLGMNVTIKNPESTNVDVLDQALLTGAARYPTSARLGQKGTVLLFGHSSYLPIVHNQAYKTFDGIQNLKASDSISVYSGTTEYRYEVLTEKVADANSDVIELRQDGTYLTLVTCDSFSKKTNRFIVTAKFVGAYPLTSN